VRRSPSGWWRSGQDRGPYRSLSDFLRRTPAALKRPAIENLIWVGGLECLGLTRRELLWQVGLWLGPESDERRSGGREDHDQMQLGLEDPYADMAFRDLEDHDRMVAEYRMLRFSAELHPLSLLKDQLPRGTVDSAELPGLRQGSTVRVAGMVTARQRPGTAKGYVFVLMEDESGPINVIIKPDIYQKHRAVVRMEPFLAIRGRLQKDGDSLNVIAYSVDALRVAGSRAPTRRRDPASLDEPSRRRRRPVDAESLPTSLPGTMEYWTDPDREGGTPFRYLTALRQHAPGVKHFG